MPVLRILLPIVIGLLLLATPAPAPARTAVPAVSLGGPGPAIGIADQKPLMFGDPRFRAFGFRAVRVSVRWDVLSDRVATAQLDAWMAGARTAGARPLVTFDRSPYRPGYNPSPAELAGTLRALRRRYRGLSEFSTWNEANLGKSPRIVARWWLALRRACPSCTILGADLIDHHDPAGWARRFIRAAGRRPAVWGLHNYTGMNRFSNRSTLAFMRRVPGRLWLTETGGLVMRNNGSQVRFAASPQHAADVTSFILGRALRAQGARVRRVYLFHWDTGPIAPPTWDSGFVGPDDAPRPALAILARALNVTLPSAPAGQPAAP